MCNIGPSLIASATPRGEKNMGQLRYNNCILLLNAVLEQAIRDFVDSEGDEQLNKEGIRYISSLLQKNPNEVLKAAIKLRAAIILYEFTGKKKDELINDFMERI